MISMNIKLMLRAYVNELGMNLDKAEFLLKWD